MNYKNMLISVSLVAAVAAACGIAISAAPHQDKYTLKVSGGLSFSEFRGYESWQLISVSQRGDVMAAILGNPVAIDAFKSGIPGNGKPFPDGSKIAKIHYTAKVNGAYPGSPNMPVAQHDADFMEKDSKRFADGHGWGYAEFEYNPSTGAFRPGDMNDKPPQAHDAKCGVACHESAESRDYVFTQYQTR